MYIFDIWKDLTIMLVVLLLKYRRMLKTFIIYWVKTTILYVLCLFNKTTDNAY